MDETLAQRIEAALGLEPGSMRGRGRGLPPSDRVRLKVWAKGVCTRTDLGVFVYNHWLDRKGPELYKTRLATVRLTRTGWEASVRGMTTHGTTAREAAEKLSSGIHTVITLAKTYREIREGSSATRAARHPTKRSGGRGSRRSSSHGPSHKG